MVWLIFSLSGVLFLAGATAIGLGVDFIDIERGWTQVIAGSVAVTGAVITLALGCILVRLGALQHSLSAASSPPPPVPTEQPDYQEGEGETQYYAVAEPSPDLSAVPAATVDAEIANVIAEQAAILPSSEEGDKPWLDAAVPASDEPEPRPVEPAPGSMPPPGKQKRNRANGLPRFGGGWPFARAARPAAIEPTPALPETAAAEASQATYSVDWLESALTKLEEDTEWAAPKQPAAPVDVPLEQMPTAEPSASAAHPMGSPDSAAPDMQTAEVVGKYSAGGVSYSIFVDGSIEADTPNGVYKFQSMEELKAFIDASGTASSTD
jgi:hypothetical protein